MNGCGAALALGLCLIYGSAALAGDSPPASAPASAQMPASNPAPDKSGYTFFNPTPEDQLRAFNPNRPSITEGPFTVDAGHFQVEMSFLEYTYDYDHGIRSDDYSVAPGDLRVGVLNNFELDLFINPYLNQWMRSSASSSRLFGFGDTEIRAALNLWGNDGGATAFGILSLLRFPTASDGLSNHHLEGGVIFPFAANLPGEFQLGAMAEFDIDRNAANTGYGMDFLQTVVVSHAFLEKFAAYVEYAGIAPVNTGHTYLAFFDTGITYLLADNVQLDAAIDIGLSGHANDLMVVTGISFRI
jgi:hypothetical protein